MAHIEEIITEVEDRWQTATSEERGDLIDKLRDAQGRLSADDELTHTRIASLIHRIESSRHSGDGDDITPPQTQGNGFGFGPTLPGRFDSTD